MHLTFHPKVRPSEKRRENDTPPKPIPPATWGGLVLCPPCARRVPAVVANTVGHEIISRSLETDSVSLARRRRDMCAEADEARWHTLMPSAFKRPSVDHSLRQARKCDGLRLTFSTLLFMPAIGKYFVPEALNVAHFIFFTISTAFAYRAYKDTT